MHFRLHCTRYKREFVFWKPRIIFVCSCGWNVWWNMSDCAIFVCELFRADSFMLVDSDETCSIVLNIKITNVFIRAIAWFLNRKFQRWKMTKRRYQHEVQVNYVKHERLIKNIRTESTPLPTVVWAETNYNFQSNSQIQTQWHPEKWEHCFRLTRNKN